MLVLSSEVLEALGQGLKGMSKNSEVPTGNFKINKMKVGLKTLKHIMTWSCYLYCELVHRMGCCVEVERNLTYLRLLQPWREILLTSHSKPKVFKVSNGIMIVNLKRLLSMIKAIRDQWVCGKVADLVNIV